VRSLKIGTRGSQLALVQARTFAKTIEQRNGTSTEISVIKTTGDRLTQKPLATIGGKRLFVKEIEEALLNGEVDVAVHSAKDMPAKLPEGLAIGAVLPRADPLDALVLPIHLKNLGRDTSAIIASLGRTPRIGTGSVRRISQLRRILPQARFDSIRGNLDTRLKKVDAREYDAIVLAVAGLQRLGYTKRISIALPIDLCVPAPGQGAIILEVRSDDRNAKSIVESVNDDASSAAVVAERTLVAALDGGCQAPIGALALPYDSNLDMWALVSTLDGTKIIVCRHRGPVTTPELLGQELADQMIAKGAQAVLEDAYRAQTMLEPHS